MYVTSQCCVKFEVSIKKDVVANEIRKKYG